MKYLLLILLSLSSLLTTSQTIYVSSSKDKRFLAYKDSLNKYNRNVNFQHCLAKRLNDCETLGEYLHVTDSLDCPTMSKEAKYSSNMVVGVDSGITYDLISRIAFGYSNEDAIVKKFYAPHVNKPIVVVQLSVPNTIPPDKVRRMNSGVVATVRPRIIKSTVQYKDTCQFMVRYETVVGTKHYTDSTKSIMVIKN